jgi:hypothetical protein
LSPDTFVRLLEEQTATALDAPFLTEPAVEASLVETLLLAAARTGGPLPASVHAAAVRAHAFSRAAPWRIGNVVVGHSDGAPDAQVLPTLASHLALDDLAAIREHVADLTWDHILAATAASADATCSKIARDLLDSPARYLARFPEVLPDLGRADGINFADFSPSRVLAAVEIDGKGGSSLPFPSPPGSKGSHSGDPRELLRDLDAAPAAWRRAAALLQLLVGPRIGEIAGVEVDLHREAATRVALALGQADSAVSSRADRRVQARDWLRFEVAALHHGAAIAARAVPNDPRRRVRAAWLFGDWIGRVLRESPFLGADPELLAARIEGTLPLQPTDEDDDALSPARMGIGRGSFQLDHVWLLYALFLAREAGWAPPGAVLAGLKRLAGRPLNAAERGAEEALEAGHNQLDWPGAHLAPPLAARWLLHGWRATWLLDLPTVAQDDTIAWLSRWLERRDARRGLWIMLALYREPLPFGPQHELARTIWLATLAEPSSLAHRMGEALGPFCLWGSTYAATLGNDEAEALVVAARATLPNWRVGVLLALAEAQNSPTLAKQAREELLLLIESKAEPTLRLPAAVAALQLVRKLPDAEREPFLERVDLRIGRDLRAHPNIRVELKRVGRAA